MHLNLNGKTIKAVERELRRAGFTEIFWIEENFALAGFINCAGVGIKSCLVTFNNNGRAVSFEEKHW